MPSSVPVAPGSGGLAYGNFSSNALTTGIVAVSTVSPAQITASGKSGSGTSGASSSPIPTFSGAAGRFGAMCKGKIVLGVVGLLGMLGV